ncbi:hypothetical protein PRZ48_008837 [Zasmidium cellare]|uniref:Uncharacterized protein n=1 Tax=Zasmidium cellare TaxID=395010 RepID=A0ABR0EHU9_ZASCE|nr:hypothetical protein PRZ48_008837 [Zasmidium cellare]
MATGPSAASESVMLDYISPFNAFALLPALRRGHYAVANVISVSLILKLAIVLSSGLFLLRTVDHLTEGVQLMVTDTFMPNTTALGLDFQPAGISIGLAQYNLAAPPGTTRTTAFQQFTKPEDVDEDTLNTTCQVDVLTSTSSCESAQVLLETTIGEGFWVTAAAFSGKCNNVSFSQMINWSGALLGSVPGNSQHIGIGFNGAWNSSYSTAFLQRLDCGLQNATSILLFAGNVTRPGDVSPIGCDPGGYPCDSPIGARIDNYSASVCHLTYEVRQLPVILTRGGGISIPENTNTSSSQLPGLTSDMLWNGTVLSFAAGDEILNTTTSPTAPAYDDKSDFPQMLQAFDPALSSAPSFADMGRFEAAIADLWATMNARFAQMYLKDPARVPVSGSIATTQSRLTLRQLPFWLLETSLIILSCCSTVLAITTTRSWLPTDCATPAGLSLVLSSSSNFMRRLTGTGTYSEKMLERLLEPSKFSTTLKSTEDLEGSTFAIRPTVSTDAPRQPQRSVKTNWFQPIPATLAYRITVPILLIAMIACLEALYSRSAKHSGIVAVASDNNYKHLAWTYIPTLIMVGVAALVSMLQFNAAALQPYILLRRIPSEARRSIIENYLGTHTFDDLALAKPGTLPDNLGNNGSLSLRMPGLRGRLNCTDISTEIEKAAYGTVPFSYGENVLSIVINLKETNRGCNTFVPIVRSFLVGTGQSNIGRYWAG